MNNIHIDATTGKIDLDDRTIAPLLLDDFIDVLKFTQLTYNHHHPNNGWHNFGFLVNFYRKEFSAVVTYRNDNIQSFFLSWHGGLSETMGYDVTEQALRTDQRTLTNFLELLLNRKSDEKNDHLANFHFSWGCITANYSIRSLTVGISITWETSSDVSNNL